MPVAVIFSNYMGFLFTSKIMTIVTERKKEEKKLHRNNKNKDFSSVHRNKMSPMRWMKHMGKKNGEDNMQETHNHRLNPGSIETYPSFSHTLSFYHALPLIPSFLSIAVSRRHRGAPGPSILTFKQIELEPKDCWGPLPQIYMLPSPFPALHCRGLHFLGGVQTIKGAGGRVLGSWMEGEAWLFLPITLCHNSNCMSPAWLNSSSVIPAFASDLHTWAPTWPFPDDPPA